MPSNQDRADDPEFVGRVREWAKEIPRELAPAAEALREKLAAHDPFEIIGHVTFRYACRALEEYEEAAEVSPAIMEYIALLGLTLPEGQHGNEPVGPDQLDAICKAAEEIFAKSSLHLTFRGLGVDDTRPPDADETARLSQSLNELAVRNPAYSHHHKIVLRRLFSPLAAELDRNCGCNVEQALCLVEAIETIMRKKLDERGRTAREEADRLKKTLRRGGRDCADLPRALGWSIRQAPIGREEEVIEVAMNTWFMLGIHTTFAFTQDELTAECGLPAAVVQSFLAALALEAGSVPADKYLLPAATHPLRATPIVHRSGSYQVPAPNLLDWAIRPWLESVLAATGKPGERYRQHRHDAIQSLAEELIRPRDAAGAGLLEPGVRGHWREHARDTRRRD